MTAGVSFNRPGRFPLPASISMLIVGHDAIETTNRERLLATVGIDSIPAGHNLAIILQ